MLDAVIVGAGISGLTCGYSLTNAGKSVVILESSHRAGGMIGTEPQEGYTLEYGPNSLRNDSPALEALINDLGLTDKIIKPSLPRFKSYIARNSKLIAIPRSPIEFISSDILSFSAKLRLLREPFIKKGGVGTDESVASFFRRRVGNEIVETLVKPMISGIFAGDPEQLSMKSTFTKFWNLEQQHGSLFRGMFANRKKNQSKLPRMFSFTNGLGTLIQALENHLQDSLLKQSHVRSILQTTNGWLTTTEDGRTFESASVICTVPCSVVSKLFSAIAEIKQLENIYYPPVTVVHLGFDQNAIKQPLDGFGFLVPPKEKSDILGCIFTSSLFPERAPNGEALLTVMMGGTTNPTISELPQQEIVGKAVLAVSTYLQITDNPKFSRSFTWHSAIPQYHIGHQEIISQIESIEVDHPGLHLIGNYRSGISIGSSITQAVMTSNSIIVIGQ